MFIDLKERKKEREKGRERRRHTHTHTHSCKGETSISCLQYMTLTGDGTCNLLVRRKTLQPTKPRSQGNIALHFLKKCTASFLFIVV